MAEIDFSVITYGFVSTVQAMTFNLSLPLTIVCDISSLIKMIDSSLKNTNSKLRRYIILLLDSVGEEGSDLYGEWEENPQIVTIFNTWDEDFIPPVKQTKLYYIPKPMIDLILPMTYIRFLKIQAEKSVKLDQISLSKIYLRKAKKIKELTMTNIRAEPSHILLIPLNTNMKNLTTAIERTRQSCAKFGYSSAIISILDEYIPRAEAYDKLPYGTLLFEYEDPTIICRWLRLLCPIRMYLYGNEQTITSDLSKQMILNEPDPFVRRIVNDDDYCIFVENELVRDDIKWNFFSRHAQSWQISNITPMNLNRLNDDIRFRSTLRRAHITYSTRMSTTTAQIFDWYDDCMQHNHLPDEFKLPIQQRARSNKPRPIESEKFALDFGPSRTMNNNNIFSPPDTDRLSILQNLHKFSPTFVWLADDFDSIDQRFLSVISPYQWNWFSNVNQCQTFLFDQQSQISTRIYLVSDYSLAAQLFAYEHATKISVAYLYSTHEELFDKWVHKFPSIRAVYKNFDRLYEQFTADLTKNIELTPVPEPDKDAEGPLPISFYDSDPKRFQRCRMLMKLLQKLSRTLGSKEDMIEYLRLTSVDNKTFLDQIDDFEQNYHSNAAIQWYTRESCLYRLVNRALRYEDMESIIKYRFFIVDLYQKLDELYQQMIEQIRYSEAKIITYYRGQALSNSEIERFKEHIGGLVSFNAFFSTSLSLDIALMFAGASTEEGDFSLRSVLFCIEVDSSIERTQPFANIDLYSVNEDEDEVLFSVGSVFRVEKVECLPNNESIMVIYLTMIDERDLPKEDALNDFLQLFPEQKLLDPIYALVGLTDVFKANELTEQIKSKLDEMGVKFFENTDELDKYMEMIRAIQSFVVFINHQMFIPERYQEFKLYSFDEKDTHFNDLVYQLLYEMERHKQLKDHMRDVYADIASIYRPLNDKTFYVQLLLSSASRKESEERLRSKLSPSTCMLTFYEAEPCLNFLQSIADENTLGNAILIFQFDGTNIDPVIDQFEPVLSVKFMYICSKNASKVAYRRIILGKFRTEDDLYRQLSLDNFFESYAETNVQIDVCKNHTEAKRSLEKTDQFLLTFEKTSNSEKQF